METSLVWSRRAADELWSGLVTPLTFSVLSEEMAEHLVRRRLQQAGLRGASRKPVFRLIQGRVYVNASLIAEVMREVPSLLLSDGLLALLPGSLAQELRSHHRSLCSPATLTTVARLSWNERGWTPWARAALFRRETSGLSAEFGDFTVPSGLSPKEIAESFAAIRRRLGSFLDIVSWTMVYAYVFFHSFVHFGRRWIPEEVALALLAGGGPKIRTFEVHEEVVALAQEVRRDRVLREALTQPPIEEVVAGLEEGAMGAVGERIRILYRQHGHRLVARDLAFPSWRERPAAVVEMIRHLSAEPPRSPKAGPREARKIAQAAISRGPGGRMRWLLFEQGLGWCREYYAARENMRYHADYFLAALRSLALAAGQHLVASDTLVDCSDVFYLTAAELEEALGGGESVDSLKEVTHDRRASYADYALEAPPIVIDDATVSAPPVMTPTGSTIAGGAWMGTPASPGVAEGRVVVVRSAAELGAVRAGDVIVATATDPTWMSYLSLAAGVVLEAGGLLSHGAIVAREMGIPAVVDLDGATIKLISGERVRVDGSAGTVEKRA